MVKNKKPNIIFDSASQKDKGAAYVDFSEFQKTLKNSTGESVLFSRGKISRRFFGDKSQLYFTHSEKKELERANSLDGICSRIEERSSSCQPGRMSRFYREFWKRKEFLKKIKNDIIENSKNYFRNLSLARLWNFSVVFAIAVGMFTMSFIYRYLGPGASAQEKGRAAASYQASFEEDEDYYSRNSFLAKKMEEYISEKNETKNEEIVVEEKSDVDYIDLMIKNLESGEKKQLEKNLSEMVDGYPIEKMVPFIAEKDKIIASFLIGIAKKESDWGKHVPVLGGQDCYNYWGYRQKRRLMGSDGHTCFNSRKDAVDTVAKRIKWLVENENLDTPDKMKVWKCGYDCSWDNRVAVKKWISDVDYYFQKLND